MSEKLKDLLTSKWVSKILSLIIAIGIWFTIFSQQNKGNKDTPVPGTEVVVPKPPATPSPNPLIPSPSVIPGQ